MCAVIGALVHNLDTKEKLEQANSILGTIYSKSHERGRDGRGHLIAWQDPIDKHARKITQRDAKRYTPSQSLIVCPKFSVLTPSALLIANLRAEPTTEYIADKQLEDQQPYTVGRWSIVHNGTIANDKALRTNKLGTSIDSAAIAEQLAAALPEDYEDAFVETVSGLKGSYAIIAARTDDPTKLYLAANYRPIWFIETDVGTFFASARDYFPSGYVPQMLTPYSVMIASLSTNSAKVKLKSFHNLYPQSKNKKRKALVVCSGGLDSVVAATYVQKELNCDIELIHFLYGSRAQGPEVKAVEEVGKALQCQVKLFPLPVYKESDSPLLNSNSEVAGGEEGAEFAHEWVPARNLLLLSVATAYAEANGFDFLVLGNNLEEAGAYPDNEPEFIARFNDLLPFAVGDGKQLRVSMPVGNMMKHEIVALGLRIGAPLHLTWSCYRAGEFHCGKCGPCFMRRTAFKINNAKEVIGYAP